MQLILTNVAKKNLKKLDITMQKRIASFFDELETLENPRTKGRGACWESRWFLALSHRRLSRDLRDY